MSHEICATFLKENLLQEKVAEQTLRPAEFGDMNDLFLYYRSKQYSHLICISSLPHYTDQCRM